MARLSRSRLHRHPQVRAAGGVVHRVGETGDTEVLLVHRPKYDDWTIPKGKLDPGEGAVEAALREVEEETGLRCEIGRELPSISYNDRQGRSKVVRYWEMTPVGGSFNPSSEVDEAQWVSLMEAIQMVSYDRDRGVLRALAESPSDL